MTNTQAAVRSFASLAVGEHASFSRTITVDDVDAFAAVSGDKNPLHTDDGYATTTQFGGRVVHGMFLGALVSQLVGMQLPGRNALLVKTLLEFKHPVMIGDTVTVAGTLTRKSEATKLVTVDLAITVGDTKVAQGEVVVSVLA